MTDQIELPENLTAQDATDISDGNAPEWYIKVITQQIYEDTCRDIIKNAKMGAKCIVVYRVGIPQPHIFDRVIAQLRADKFNVDNYDDRAYTISWD